MCGLTGFVDFSRRMAGAELQQAAQRMAASIVHRGPDDGGVWVDAEVGVALAHRRLSILDLSPEGHQPMVSASGRYVVSFNGEIYNFQVLRDELAVRGHGFRGRSDTEVMLAAFEEWGVAGALPRLNGMFAFVVWDRQARVLSLARDRIGEKPLYYGWCGDVFLFGSELKALRAHPAFDAQVDRNALSLFLRYNYVPAPYSIYQGIGKLVPGTFLTLVAQTPAARRAAPRRYWSAASVFEAGARRPFRGDAVTAAQRLETLLRQAVASRMVADVPVGAFLSGGIDSSLVVALMQAQSPRPVRTFTIGFREPRYDEAAHARAVARHLGTAHTELYLTPQDAMAVIPRLPTLYDEPFSDSSQIPTFLVAQLARRDVTVALSGDGGDELFYGYERYAAAQALWRRVGWVSANMRRACGSALKPTLPVLGAAHPSSARWTAKVAEILQLRDAEAVYLRSVSHWKNSLGPLVIGGEEPPVAVTDRSQWPNLPEFAQKMMYFDLVSYLPDDILVKVDRASMGVGLEGRVPLLDPHLIQFAARLPTAWKWRHGQGKWLLRQVLYRYVPQSMVDRRKMGFSVPIGAWLRGPLRGWAEALLDEARLRDEGFFHPAPIRRKWQLHLAGYDDGEHDLWSVLMFQSWWQAQREGVSARAPGIDRPGAAARRAGGAERQALLFPAQPGANFAL